MLDFCIATYVKRFVVVVVILKTHAA